MSNKINRNLHLRVARKTNPHKVIKYTLEMVHATIKGDDGECLILEGICADTKRNKKLKNKVTKKYNHLYTSLQLKAVREAEKDKNKPIEDEDDGFDFEDERFDYTDELRELNNILVADLYPKYVITGWNMQDDKGKLIPYDDNAQKDLREILLSIDHEDLEKFAKHFQNRLNFQEERDMTKLEGQELGEGSGSTL